MSGGHGVVNLIAPTQAPAPAPEQHQQPANITSISNLTLGEDFRLTTTDDLLDEIKLLRSDLTDMEQKMDDMKDQNTDLLTDNENLHKKVDAQSEIISKIFNMQSNLNRFLMGKDPVAAMATSNEVAVSSNQLENYEDLETMTKFKTTEELDEFEQKLKEPNFTNRVVGFLKTKFNFTMKSEMLFKLVLRRLTDVELYAPFSWKGKGNTNTSFALKHKVFVSFMCRVIRLADSTKSATDVDKFFENHLRFKNQHMKRDRERGQKPPNLPSNRTRIPNEILEGNQQVTNEDDTSPTLQQQQEVKSLTEHEQNDGGSNAGQ